MDNTNNKEYWNDYVKYWENKVIEANSESKSVDKTTSDTGFVDYVTMLQIRAGDKLLDLDAGRLGCILILESNTKIVYI